MRVWIVVPHSAPRDIRRADGRSGHTARHGRRGRRCARRPRRPTSRQACRTASGVVGVSGRSPGKSQCRGRSTCHQARRAASSLGESITLTRPGRRARHRRGDRRHGPGDGRSRPADQCRAGGGAEGAGAPRTFLSPAARRARPPGARSSPASPPAPGCWPWTPRPRSCTAPAA